jgi:hypothetical protein
MAVPSKLIDQLLGLPEEDRRELREILAGSLAGGASDGDAASARTADAGEERDDLDEADRAELHASIARGRADVAAGRLTPADDALANLRRQ